MCGCVRGSRCFHKSLREPEQNLEGRLPWSTRASTFGFASPGVLLAIGHKEPLCHCLDDGEWSCEVVRLPAPRFPSLQGLLKFLPFPFTNSGCTDRHIPKETRTFSRLRRMPGHYPATTNRNTAFSSEPVTTTPGHPLVWKKSARFLCETPSVPKRFFPSWISAAKLPLEQIQAPIPERDPS